MLKPIAHLAIVKPMEVEEAYKGMIDLSALDKVAERNAQVIGTLVALGEDFAVAFRPKTPYWGLKPGDMVVYAKHAGKWVKDPKTGEEVLFVLDQDIVGTYEDDSNVVAS